MWFVYTILIHVLVGWSFALHVRCATTSINKRSNRVVGTFKKLWIFDQKHSLTTDSARRLQAPKLLLRPKCKPVAKLQATLHGEICSRHTRKCSILIYTYSWVFLSFKVLTKSSDIIEIKGLWSYMRWKLKNRAWKPLGANFGHSCFITPRRALQDNLTLACLKCCKI